ncbi:MAG: hypothetical protein IPQ07_01905 [Myxococcales bacterium]|nr:hypothetical protein [Myxococcales bacterium]
MKVCLRALDSSASLDADRIELIVAQVDDEKIEAFDFRSGKNARARRSFQAVITTVARARWGEPKAAREDITVPAGHFAQAWRGSETYTLGGQTIDISLWAHPAVPVAGTVRVTISNGDEVVLIDFGQDGARTTLPNVPGA